MGFARKMAVFFAAGFMQIPYLSPNDYRFPNAARLAAE